MENIKGFNLSGVTTIPATYKTNNSNKPAEVTSKNKTTKVVLAGLGGLATIAIAAIAIKKGLNIAEMRKQAKLPFSKLSNVGENITETIEKTFGKNSSVKPHSYDLSKEHNVIEIISNDFNGWHWGCVGKDDKYLAKLTKKDRSMFTSAMMNPLRDVDSLALETIPKGLVDAYKNKGYRFSDYVINGRRIVRFSQSPKVDRFTNKRIREGISIKLLSPNKNLTPAQADLLKLIEHPERIDMDVFNKICELQNGNHVNANYDLLLSAIQTMTKGL